MTLTGAMAGLAAADSTVYRSRDLWEHKDLQWVLSSQHDLSVLVKPHNVVMLKLTAAK